MNTPYYTKAESDAIEANLRRQYNYGASEYQGFLTKAQTPTLDGWYWATEIGTYTNAGGLVTLANKINMIEKDGTTFRLNGIDAPSATVVDGFASNSTTEAGSANNDRLLDEKIDNHSKYTGLGKFKKLGSIIPNSTETDYFSTQKYFVINNLTADSKSNVKKVSINHGAVGSGVVFYVAVVKINSGVLTIKDKIKLTTTGTNSVQNYDLDLVIDIGDKIAISNTNKLAKYNSSGGTGYFIVNSDFSTIDNTSSNLNFGVSIEVEEINSITLNDRINNNSEDNRKSVVYNLNLDLSTTNLPVNTSTQAFANLNWINEVDAIVMKIYKGGDNLIKLYKINHGNNNFSLIETIDISRYNLGEIVTIPLKNKQFFNKGEYIALSGVLYYKDSLGTGSIRIQGIGSTVLMVDDNNSLNIGFRAVKFPAKTLDSLKINLIGKKLSILADSISTYEGFIPVGNEKFYPRTDSPTVFDVNSVEKTWWKKLINETGLVLDVNNSWSGSKVADGVNLNNEGVQRKAFVTNDRLNNLGNPDYLIIFGGTNDYGSGYSTILGNIAKNPVDWNLQVFTHAYQYMIYNLQKKLPRTKIICCSPLQRAMFAESNIYPIKRWPDDLYLHQVRDRIEEITKIYGVNFVDLYNCGITYFNSNDNPTAVGMTNSIYLSDGLHPREVGMDLIKNKILKNL